MHISIFAYDREEMLKRVLADFVVNIPPDERTIHLYRDGVDFPHRGKKGFWKTWSDALTECERSNEELFLFSPDDFLNYDFKRLFEYHERLKGKPYVCNIINDGRWQSWGAFKKQEPVNGIEQVGFTDCGFFCNREALEEIGFFIDPIHPARWKGYPNLSSGVGQQLTGRFSRAGVKMYKPVKSLAYHGDHESKMNPEERKKNPLISK